MEEPPSARSTRGAAVPLRPRRAVSQRLPPGSHTELPPPPNRARPCRARALLLPREPPHTEPLRPPSRLHFRASPRTAGPPFPRPPCRSGGPAPTLPPPRCPPSHLPHSPRAGKRGSRRGRQGSQPRRAAISSSLRGSAGRGRPASVTIDTEMAAAGPERRPWRAAPGGPAGCWAGKRRRRGPGPEHYSGPSSHGSLSAMAMSPHTAPSAPWQCPLTPLCQRHGSAPSHGSLSAMVAAPRTAPVPVLRSLLAAPSGPLPFLRSQTRLIPGTAALAMIPEVGRAPEEHAEELGCAAQPPAHSSCAPHLRAFHRD